MMAVLTQKEIIEAVKEWCEKRGIPPTDDVQICGQLKKGTISSNPSTPEYEFYIQMRGIQMPPKEGPYR